jgi:hypothetical protein
VTDDEPNLFVGLARLTIAQIAAMDVADCQVWAAGNVCWFEPCYARARGLTGRLRGRYQRAFHRALKNGLAKT